MLNCVVSCPLCGACCVVVLLRDVCIFGVSCYIVFRCVLFIGVSCLLLLCDVSSWLLSIGLCLCCVLVSGGSLFVFCLL